MFDALLDITFQYKYQDMLPGNKYVCIKKLL